MSKEGIASDEQRMDYIVICQSAWMNESGYGITYGWDRKRFSNLPDAMKHGWELRGSDDFNTARVEGDNLTWFGWMDQCMDEDHQTMAEIAAEIGLKYQPA